MALQGPSPRSSCQGYKQPRHPSDLEGLFSKFLLFAWYFSTRFSLFQTQKTHKKTPKKKNTSKLLNSSLFTKKTQCIVLIPNLLFLGSTLWIWGLGVWMYLLATIHTPNLLNLFLAFILLLCLNNKIYLFLQHVSCFLCVSSLNLFDFMLYAMFHAQIYIFTCMYVQIYMLRVLCHVFLCFMPLSVLG